VAARGAIGSPKIIGNRRTDLLANAERIADLQRAPRVAVVVLASVTP